MPVQQMIQAVIGVALLVAFAATASWIWHHPIALVLVLCGIGALMYRRLRRGKL